MDLSKWKLAAVAAFVVLLVVGWFALHKEAPVREEKTPLVKAQVVGTEKPEAEGRYAGAVKARYETNLSFQVGGQILSRNVQVGSRVQPGEVLMIIDPKDVVQQSNVGEAQVDSARARLRLAQTNLSRYNQLYREEAVPESVRDQYQMEYDSAFAAYQAALAQAAQAGNALSYTNLTAGAAGVISAIQAEEGQVVSAGQTVMTLSQTDELEVEMNVPENKLGEISVGKAVKVTFWALSGMVDGTVREISPMADAAARTYRVRVSVPNPPKGMELGMTASVSVAEEEAAADSSVIPLSAVYQTGDTAQVWVVEDGKAVLREVQVLSFQEREVSVRGLRQGDVVIVAGVHKLREGQAVRTEAKK